MVRATVPVAPPPPAARKTIRIGNREVTLVEYRGFVPEATAEYLRTLSEWERPSVEGILGTFEEVRAILGGARLLHRILREGPLAAARGCLSFQELMDEKAHLMEQVMVLRRRIHQAAEKVRLILPRFPQRKENDHARQAHRRVS